MSSFDEALELYWNKMKLDGRSGLLLEYTPIFGPLFTSGTALRALINSFGSKPSSDQVANEQTSKIIRVKGLSAICSGLVDISLLCFCVVVMAFIGDNLTKISSNVLVYRSTFLIIVLNCLAVSIGAKLVSVQMIEFSTSQLEQVQTVSSSVVKSASITASAIEKIVITTNHRTGLAIGAFDSFVNRIVQTFLTVLSFPTNVKRRLYRLVKLEFRRLLRFFRLFTKLLLLARLKKSA